MKAVTRSAALGLGCALGVAGVVVLLAGEKPVYEAWALWLLVVPSVLIGPMMVKFKNSAWLAPVFAVAYLFVSWVIALVYAGLTDRLDRPVVGQTLTMTEIAETTLMGVIVGLLVVLCVCWVTRPRYQSMLGTSMK